MKRRRGFVLFADDGGWRVGVGTKAGGTFRSINDAGAGAADATTQAGRLGAVLTSLGADISSAVLALPAGACLCSSVSVEGLPRRSRRRAMLYRLEEKLPVAAEEAAADFITRDGGALGVCAPLGTLQPTLDALDAIGVAVKAVCPAALLALAGLARAAEGGRALASDVLLWQEGETLDCFALFGGRVASWASLPAELPDLALALSACILARQSALRVTLVSIDAELRPGIEAMPDVAVVSAFDLSRDEAVLLAAESILAGRDAPPVDLRGGGAGDAGGDNFRSRQWRPAFVGAAAAIALLCCCLVGALLWRAGRYASLARDADAKKEAIFRRLFPGQTPPVGIESRLRSVERELAGSAGTAVPGGGPGALLPLREVLTHLPADVRYRITELDVDGGKVSLQGEGRSNADADAFAAALRRSARLSVEDPQTQQIGGQVIQFSIAGAIREPSKPTGRREP